MSNSALKYPITDYEIETLLLMRQEYELAKKQMEQIKSDIESCENQIIRNLDLGIGINSRHYQLDVREVERRFPSWKEHFIDLAGKDEVDRILEETEPKLYRNLVIREK